MRESGMPSRRRPVRERRRLVVDALPHVDAQLRCAGGDDRVRLGREDQHRDAGTAQARDPHAVRPADPHGLAAVRRRR